MRLPVCYDETTIDGDVVIEDNVWLGQNVTILQGVKIGEGAIIQAGSVVVSDIPSCSIAGGHPAKVFKMSLQEGHFFTVNIWLCVIVLCVIILALIILINVKKNRHNLRFS